MARLFFWIALLYFAYRFVRYLLSRPQPNRKPIEDAEYEELP
jgi:hypothetical protein|nr:MAG: hypothetical protein KatS3mg041_2064 [Bacteroidota bacterium]